MITVRIKDICESGSSNLKQKDVQDKKGIYPVYGASGIIGYADTYRQDNDYIAIVKDGSGIGRVSFMPAKSSVIATMQYILPKHDYNINYIGYCLKSLNLSSYRQGAAIPHIYFKDYGERVVNISENISEQQSIVNYLDSAFAKIDTMKQNAKKSLEEAQVLFKTALNEYLTPKEDWGEKRMDEICSIEANLVDSTLEENQDLLHVGGANIISYTGQLVELRTARDEKLTSGKFKFDNSVILYNKIRPYLVKVALPNFSGLCSADMYPLNPKANILKDFLYYILISSDFTVYAIKGSARAGMPKVNRKWLFAYKCHIPHYEEQVYIANRLNAIKAKIELLTKNNASIYEECDALKQAILKQIFG